MHRHIHVLLFGSVVALMSVIAACATWPGSSGGEQGSPVPSSSAPAGGIAGPRNGLREATLDLSAGASQITVRAASLGATLYRVTPEGATSPRVSFNAPTLAVGNGEQNPRHLTVVLNQEVGWKLNLNGGSTHEIVDMRTGRIQSLTLAAGANRIDVQLGAPHGIVPVQMTGGANEVALRIPSGGAASVHLALASSVTVNGQSRGKVTGGATFDVGASASDRYQVDLMAGLNTLTVDQG